MALPLGLRSLVFEGLEGAVVGFVADVNDKSKRALSTSRRHRHAWCTRMEPGRGRG